MLLCHFDPFWDETLSFAETSFSQGILIDTNSLVSPKYWAHSPYRVAHYPVYCSVLHIIDVSLGLLVVIVHLCLLYIGRRYFNFIHHCILCGKALGETREFVSIKIPCEQVVSTKETNSPKNGWKWHYNRAYECL